MARLKRPRDPNQLAKLIAWTAICADTKLAPFQRNAFYADRFVNDLAGRLAVRPQVTTDGLKLYLKPMEEAFRANVDYAMLVKIYGKPHGSQQERRYNSGECCGTIKGAVCGDPDEKYISTSFVERQNLTMRMAMRRFTRLTNGFSKKVQNHACAVALHYMHYNFGRIHKTLRVTPAMQAGIADHVWTLEEIANLAAQIMLLDLSAHCLKKSLSDMTLEEKQGLLQLHATFADK